MKKKLIFRFYSEKLLFKNCLTKSQYEVTKRDILLTRDLTVVIPHNESNQSKIRTYDTHSATLYIFPHQFDSTSFFSLL